MSSVTPARAAFDLVQDALNEGEVTQSKHVTTNGTRGDSVQLSGVIATDPYREHYDAFVLPTKSTSPVGTMKAEDTRERNAIFIKYKIYYRVV